MRKREEIGDKLAIAADQHVKERDYWLEELSGDLVKTTFPYDFKESAPGELQEGQGSLSFSITGEIFSMLIKLSNDVDHMLHMILAAGWVVLLDKYNYNGNRDIIVGAPIYRQEDDDVGELINRILPLRHRLREHLTFKDLLLQVKETIIRAAEHYRYPMEILPEQLGLASSSPGMGFPLFDVAVLVENIHDKSYLEHIRIGMTVSFLKTGDRIDGKLEYNTALYKKSSVELIIKHFTRLMAEALSHVHLEIRRLSILMEEEKNQILYDFNNTSRDYPGSGDYPVHHLFEQQVERTPDKTALIFEDRQVTYRELNQRANTWAYFLRARGVKPNTIAAIMVESSPEMVIGILGILKAGGAYLPIDPGYPESRVWQILNDGSASLLLTKGNLLNTFAITSFKQLSAREVEPVFTGPREQVKDFDRLPIPDRTLVNNEAYHQFIGIAMGKRTVSLQTSRGCPFNCAYCHKLWPKTHVARSAENIFTEISRCFEAGIRRFVFIDDIFNLERKNSTRLLEMIIKQDMGLQLFFPNGLRGDILAKEFIDLMVSAGTVNTALALESVSPRIQRLIHKNLNLEKFQENVGYFTQKYPQVILEMELMLGFPTETEEETRQTLDFVKKYQWIHFPNVHVLKIYPNTDMYRIALENGISEAAIHSSVNLAYHELPETLPYPKAFVRQEQTRVMNEYILSKERLLHVLPQQMKTLTEEELIQKYDSYLPASIKSFDDILKLAGISRQELGNPVLLKDADMEVPGFREKMRAFFPREEKAADAMRILFLDLSQFFTRDSRGMLYDMVEEPLGLMYLLTYLNEKFPQQVEGKIAKSRIDFDSYKELNALITGFKPHLIGIRSLSFYKEFFHRTVSLIRQWGIDVPIISGGPYATSDYISMLRDPNIDLAVLGEGELIIEELVGKMIRSGKKLPDEEILKEIKGIAYLSRKDKNRLKEMNREIVFLDNAAEAPAAHPMDNPVHVNQTNDLLYLISTSGSTGGPKSVMLEHRNLVNLLNFQFLETGIDYNTDILQFSSIGFDVSAQEIFSALLSGGKLCLMDRDLKGDVFGLLDFIRRNKIGIVFWPPAFLKLIFSEPGYAEMFPGSVRHIIAAGEQLFVPPLLKKHLTENRVYLTNNYGPSETHVVTTLTLEPAGEIPARPSIGKPITNTAIYILDEEKNLQPIGVIGELYIAGANVGRGYYNREDLTRERYSPDPFFPGGPMYRTGDLARWLPDGNIEFIGRNDSQVQIRGFRVELGEIENRLREIEYIKEALVIERMGKGERNYLCGYIVSETAIDSSGLRAVLSKSLPDFMIPSYIMQIEKIPLTPNGKVDRRVLPDPETVLVGKTRVAPGNEIEEKLINLWADVLEIGKKTISVTDNFFELGGHSLKATILVTRVHKVFNVRMTLGEMFKQPTIRQLAEFITGAAEERYAAIQPAEEKEYYDVSPAQKRMYLIHRMEEKSTRYNTAAVRLLEGHLETERLERVFRELIHRHESLRTSFELIEDKPVQEVHDVVEFEIEYLAARNAKDREDIIRNFIRPFNLSKAPLLRLGLIKETEQSHILMLDMHHIISDGISIGNIAREFMAWYAGEKLKPLKLQYKDYSEWQQGIRGKERQALLNRERYWLKQFESEIPVLELPTDYARPDTQSFEGCSSESRVGEEDTKALKKLALDSEVTLFTLLFTAYNVFLWKLTGQEDIVVGTPVAGRRHADLQPIIGVFVNTLALLSHPRGDQTFGEFLLEVKENTVAAFENQDFPFEDLVEKLAIRRDMSRSPIFDVMFTLQNLDIPGLKIPGLSLLPYNYENKTSKFDLTLHAVESEGSLVFTFEYSTSLFREETIQRFTGYFERIITGILEDKGRKLWEIEIIPEEEKKQVLFDFNDTYKEYPAYKTLHELFAEQVQRTPDSAAVVGHGCMNAWLHEEILITYRELNKRSKRLAHLLKEKGVLADSIVGIKVERSVEMIIGILGILKAGGAYLPIDPEYPQERIDYMLKDSKAKVLLAAPAAQVKVKAEVKEENIEIIDISRGFSFSTSTLTSTLSQVSPANLAYIIYTSGSTGRPKGVLTMHSNV
ncbi:MAG: AMP-binding protein, partial [Candidatus Aminicenantes bacterium]|nr:AMP-binding protein [Candidatus Aminicenantes bacterium]NIM84713.1 AMP-binding protein [Candidatus Aminicenantes bacterium]NIN24207.1 AMP-binding protein [Candidatus Aminicenantes bacterium]NIN47932.1 AMP-binding protein [Candidatus Aminicenantes bacterium]NIN90870.1 AMP-binding protein [Candidatus Aminicenantes bacterium]